MKTSGIVTLLIFLSLCLPVAQARDTAYYFPVKDVIEQGKARGKLGEDVKFYFGGQAHPAVEEKLAQDFVVSKKTSWHRTTDEDDEMSKGCSRALLAALLVLQKNVRDKGGNAVVNIEGFFKKKSFRSNDQFECHSGSFLTGVTLKGDIVRLKN